MAHEDFTGSVGVLRPGDLQFMSAGKGIVHSEIPVKTNDGKACTGMQLWVDLPAELKDSDPLYRDLKREEVPIVQPDDDVTVKVIAGEAYGVKSAQDLAKVAVDYYDYEVVPGGEFTQKFPVGYNVFLYLLEGSLVVDEALVEQNNVVFFKQDGDFVSGKVPSDQNGNTRLVVIGGQPLDQPVIQHGLFVATSKEKIRETFDNFENSQNGFEHAKSWTSKIKDGITEDDAVVKQLVLRA